MFHVIKKWLFTVTLNIVNFFTRHDPIIRATIGDYYIAFPKPKAPIPLTHKVYLEFEGLKRIDVTQPPGTIYHYHPKDFGALYYVIVSINSGEETIIHDRINVNNKIKRKAIAQ